MTQKSVPFLWDDKCEKAFQRLRENLVTAPVLAYPNLEQPFILTTDASDVAISYVLSQEDEGGAEHPIAYSGRALRKAELAWTTTEKEALAVISGFKFFNPYLINNFTTVVTDHNALVHIKSNTKMTGKVAWWALILQSYHYKVIHKKGRLNTNADTISRLENFPEEPEGEANLESDHVSIFVANPEPQDVIERGDPVEINFGRVDDEFVPETVFQINKIDLQQDQINCPQVGPYYKFFKDNVMPNNIDLAHTISSQSNEFGIANGILYHIYKPRTKNSDKYKPTLHQMVVPESTVLPSCQSSTKVWSGEVIRLLRELLKAFDSGISGHTCLQMSASMSHHAQIVKHHQIGKQNQHHSQTCQSLGCLVAGIWIFWAHLKLRAMVANIYCCL